MPRTVGLECVRPRQVVVDVGINWDEVAGRLVGDVDFDGVSEVVDGITPVPGRGPSPRRFSPNTWLRLQRGRLVSDGRT